MAKLSRTLKCLLLLSLPLLAAADGCDSSDNGGGGGGKIVLKYKAAAITSILIAGVIGVCLPIFGGKINSFRPEGSLFLLIKSFAAGVILATGFVHILPDAYENLTSPCFGESPPWGDFPITGLIAMASAIFTMMIDSFATGYFKRTHCEKAAVASLPVRNKEAVGGHEGHAHGSAIALEEGVGPASDIRHKIVSQVLEFGIVVHSVIIGLSLGASQSAETIRPLVVALTFHQFFEGIGLGGCISQAKFRTRAIVTMVIFFSLTTPVGIGVGIGVSEIYNENSPTALIVQGILNAAAAGILIYMALVDLLAADFMSPRIQGNLKMQFGCSFSLLLGAGCMSLLAKWA